MRNKTFFGFLVFGLLLCGVTTSFAGNTKSDEQGRFVFKQISDNRRDQFMIDTATGRLWNVVCKKVKDNSGESTAGDCSDGMSVLVPVYYVTFVDGRKTVSLTPR
jgi:hypothetical protein